tara:strand:+ start:4852 stop:5841 length:990 start_codon:yes stop_codon:yes gene_type:complete
MATNFTYAGISDLTKYFNRVSDFDSKVQIFPTLTSGNLHLFRDCGYVDKLFVNGEELAAAQSTSGAVDSNGEWFYASATNQVEYYNSNYSSTTINEQVFEVGQDFTDFLNQTLVDASLELHNYLDARYSTPLEKIKQVDIDTAAISTSEEYDPIIIKAVCYIATSNIIRAKEGPSEEADYFMSLVTNPERTGLVDKLNDGVYKLSSEVDANDKKGSIRYRNVSGSMDIVEVSGEYSGGNYDILKVEIEDTGAYGVGTYKTHYLANDKLFGAVTDSNIITGGLQELVGGSGIWVRFQGASATDGDIWEIEVYGSHIKQTNKSNATIELSR